jgi:nicotinate-nucleotide pyrophosphorylase (carboxylating)
MTLRPEVTEKLTAAGLDPADTERVVRCALEEDLRYGPDLTSAATVPPGATAAAGVVARAPGVVAGLPVALAVLDTAGVPPAAAEPLRTDGDRVARGTEVLRITAAAGDARGRADAAQLSEPPVRGGHHHAGVG